MANAELIRVVQHNMAHVEAGTIEQAPSVAQIPAEHYYDQDRFDLEVAKIFRRMPLMLAMTAELKNPGDYKALTAAGVPVLITRDQDGVVHAFVNSCSHRGAPVVNDGRGNTHRFTCPYHAWSYDQQGALTGVYLPKDFGDIDKSCYGLTKLPVLERSGLIWVTLDPKSTLNIEDFLCGYDELLDAFGFADWHHFESREVKGPNWKIAYDGYLDFYHLPILHKDSFGADMQNQALYYAYGPHQRLTAPNKGYLEFKDKPTDEWPQERLMDGVWTIFPHISIATFDGGGRSVMISQLFPGAKPGESITVQNYLMQDAPDKERAEAAHQQFLFLEHVVQNEDYATGLRQQTALETGTKSHVLFGRNESGGQNFHGWVDRLLKASDEELPALFREAAQAASAVPEASAG
ncbi:MAG: aromatic ring-hydroxylating dioxygenase subunit alpha [Pseudomonadota bacterium]